MPIWTDTAAAGQDDTLDSTFDRMIHPMGRGIFLDKYWGKSFVHIRGEANRFSKTFDWPELNSLLQETQYDLKRMRLFRDGKPLDRGRYTNVKLSRLKPASLVACLSEGATLIMDSVDDYSHGLKQICRACEHVFLAPTCINLYAGWRTQKGFDLHWDSQDTIILQVSGRKHWKVYRPTCEHPLSTSIEKPRKPNEDPYWDSILEQGDLIYLPRGWWHVAHPLDEPSLHLTVTVVPPTGLTILEWLVSELRKNPAIRRNVPLHLNQADRREYAAELGRMISNGWSGAIFERFVAEWVSELPVPTKIRLPYAPAEFQAEISMNTHVRLATIRQLSLINGSENTVAFYANGMAWDCPESFAPALARLRSASSCTVESLCAALDAPELTARFIAFLAALAMAGVIWNESSPELSN